MSRDSQTDPLSDLLPSTGNPARANPAMERVLAVLNSFPGVLRVQKFGGYATLYTLDNGREVIVRQVFSGPAQEPGVEVYYNTPTMDLDAIELELRALAR